MKIRRCGLIANETTLHQRPNNIEGNNYYVGPRTALNNKSLPYTST